MNKAYLALRILFALPGGFIVGYYIVKWAMAAPVGDVVLVIGFVLLMVGGLAWIFWPAFKADTRSVEGKQK